MRLLFSIIILFLIAILLFKLFPNRTNEVDFSNQQRSRFSHLTRISNLIYAVSTLLFSLLFFGLLSGLRGILISEDVLYASDSLLWLSAIFFGLTIAFFSTRLMQRRMKKREEAAFEQYLELYYNLPSMRLHFTWIVLFFSGIMLSVFSISNVLKMEEDQLIDQNIFVGSKKYPITAIRSVTEVPLNGYRIVLSSGATITTASYRGDVEQFISRLNEKRRATVENTFALVIHGGAGTILKSQMRPEIEQEYTTALTAALEAGRTILAAGGSAEEAVVAAISLLEAAPQFNAGKGAVLNANGEAELDASIMNGKTGAAGAVSGVKTVKHPILLAREVMNNSNHVMLSGAGAEAFAQQRNLEIVENAYFITPRNLERLNAAQRKPGALSATTTTAVTDDKFGTVGAVALDKKGTIVAGTSTGGMVNKRFGRVGDSPIIGAGTYANNTTCGISATGHGEFFIRNVVAYDIHAIMAYKGLSLADAAHEVIQEKLGPIGGTGGVIGLDQFGDVVMEFNTRGMYRGYIKNQEPAVVAMYGK
ncbi:MAG: isoaspartyl peptidase/L-asparaginase [Schleiferiaceae bacterium]|nr:isoaspartyl peptidase/L-asparaginase [Schleiferiaceae bacterium]